MKKSIIISLTIAIIFGACRGKKSRATPVTKTPIDSSKPVLPEIKNVLNTVFEYDYLSYKAKCDYKDDNMDQSFTMNIRMKRDSIIWLSITAVGFEVARARLDKDSVKVISRLEKKYFVYGYDYIKKITGTTLSLLQIQNLLTANLLFGPENYKATSEKIKFKTTEGYIENTLTLDDKSKIIEQILQHLVEQSNANVIYSDYKKTDRQQFPGKVDISVITPKRNISLLMENSGMSIDNIDAFPFEIPTKYEKGN
ncbi:MAG: DUF4292 domain-containing protein [Bacteroidia bacterium]